MIEESGSRIQMFFPESKSVFGIEKIMDLGPVCPERLNSDPSNIKLDRIPWKRKTPKCFPVMEPATRVHHIILTTLVTRLTRITRVTRMTHITCVTCLTRITHVTLCNYVKDKCTTSITGSFSSLISGLLLKPYKIFDFNAVSGRLQDTGFFSRFLKVYSLLKYQGNEILKS